MDKKYNLLAIVVLLSLGLCWGSGYSLARLVMSEGVNPLHYSFYQTLGPAILLNLALIYTQEYKKVAVQYWWFYLFCGIFGILVPNTNMYFAAAHLPSGILALVVNTVPIITYGLSLIFLRAKFKIVTFYGVLCAVVGLLLILWPGLNLHQAINIRWILIALITPLCFAISAIFTVRFAPANNGPLVLSTMMLNSALLGLFPLVYWLAPFSKMQLTALASGAVSVASILATLGYLLFFKLLRIAGPIFYGFISAVVALVGIIWGRIFFAEVVLAPQIGGIALILLALLLSAVDLEPQQSSVQ